MATYTTNLNLKKPAQSDKIRIADINNNMDDIDAAFGAIGNDSVATQIRDIQDAVAIVAVGDSHAAVTAGEFVYVKSHETLDVGLYKATANIAQNAALSSSNLTAESSGGLNALNSKITTQQNILRFQIENGSYVANDNAIITQTYPTSGTPDAYASNNTIKFRRAGNIEIFIHVIGQQDNTSQRLWFELIGSNLVTQHISYGYYCTGDIATIAQVNTSSELSIKFLEAFKVGQGGVGTSYIFVKYM